MMTNDPQWVRDCTTLGLALIMLAIGGGVYLFGAWLFRGWQDARVTTATIPLRTMRATVTIPAGMLREGKPVRIGCIAPGTETTVPDAVYVVDADGVKRYPPA